MKISDIDYGKFFLAKEYFHLGNSSPCCRSDKKILCIKISKEKNLPSDWIADYYICYSIDLKMMISIEDSFQNEIELFF